MKKMMSLFLILTMICFGAALAEGTEAPAGTAQVEGAEAPTGTAQAEGAETPADTERAPITGAFEDGNYIIRIPVPAGEAGEWKADEADPEGVVVHLASAELKDGVFTAVYAPVADGEGTVSIRHLTGPACDRIHGYTLLVRNGAVQEVTSGSYTEAPLEADLDPVLSGAWLEDETQFTSLTLTKNPEKGWDAVITSPLTHSAYVFRALALPDCEKHGLVYDSGEWRDLASDGSEVAEPAATGTAGQLVIGAKDEKTVTLTWTDSRNPDATPVVFVRADAE